MVSILKIRQNWQTSENLIGVNLRKENAVEDLGGKIWEWGALYGTKIIGAIAILVIGRIVVGILTGIIKKLMRKGKT
ncbi:MAG: hypothetical protein JSU69_08485, partial [Candidatus Zixiibacteriota bacterium]